MDVCLQEYGHCNFISEKHCSIFYDEVLLSYVDCKVFLRGK